MTEPTTTTPTEAERLLADAVRTFTAAARLPHGPDFAEFVTLAVAGAAANVGGIEAVLAGRPGSWEADYVRNMLISTVGSPLSVRTPQRCWSTAPNR